MESRFTEDITSTHDKMYENQDVEETESPEKFQKFIYELFEKNGVLNDLRSCLRGHIVSVLKSAETGDPPACQKHFTQRLDQTYQALNILIAEYLLCLEFSYSLSVFVSELPLANMVFGFAKMLLEDRTGAAEGIRFKDCDMWSIINYLGIKCDSNHATSIVEMYKNEPKTPLLLCILKCLPLYKMDPRMDHGVTSDDSLNSVKSTDTGRSCHRSHHECKHYSFCKTCQNRVMSVKDKYRRKKKELAKMFQQLKSVYETEVDMVKEEEEKKVKHSIATHELQIKQQRYEMEQSFQTREAALELNVQQKKRFLWGLARALRDQHAAMAKAMRDVRAETARLTEKEQSLKSQLADAERTLKERGEDMRKQITEELTVLETHLDSMKRERESINKQRSELTNKQERQEDLKTHYDLLKNELLILKKYLASTKMEPKCAMERGTMTEGVLLGLNNEVEVNNGKEEVRGQVVNDLKKKNVNFNQSHLDEIYRERSAERCRSSASSEAEDRSLVKRLRDENENLRAFARQQREHIDELANQEARLQAELCAARHRPPDPPRGYTQAAPAWMMSSGGGEALSAYSGAAPRVLLPRDVLPLVTALRDKRQLVSQWRALRRRASPLGGLRKRAHPAVDRERPTSGGTTLRTLHRKSADPSTLPPTGEHARELLQRPQIGGATSGGSNSPKSVLREAKQNLRPKARELASSSRESPGVVLREAKLRLRRLEIEAEAVESSYRDFRRRQDTRDIEKKYESHNERSDHTHLRERHKIYADALEKARRLVEKREEERRRDSSRDDRMASSGAADAVLRDIDDHRQRSMQRLKDTYRAERETIRDNANSHLDKYLREYTHKYDLGLQFRNKNVTEANPIPHAYSNVDTQPEKEPYSEPKRVNYIETPLTEFRKLYHTEKSPLRAPIKKSEPKDKSPSVVQKSETKLLIHEPEENSTKVTEIEFHRSEESPSRVTKSKCNAPNEFGPSETSISEVVEKTESRQKGDSGKRPIKSEIAKYSKEQELKILKENMNKLYSNEENITLKKETAVTNLLKVEIETGDVTVHESPARDVLLVVRSADSDVTDDAPPKMTILVTPKVLSPPDGPFSVGSAGKESPVKRATTPDGFRRSESPEKAAGLTRNDVFDALFHDRDSPAPRASDSDLDKALEDYPDDFSADVDNYNSRSCNNSPVSLPKTSDDENFWNS